MNTNKLLINKRKALNYLIGSLIVEMMRVFLYFIAKVSSTMRCIQIVRP